MINTILHDDVISHVANPVICLIRKFQILSPEESKLDSEVKLIMDTIQKHDISEIGHPSGFTKSAHLKLLNNFNKNGFRRHNNLVDTSNIASLENNISIGLHDGEGVKEDIHIELTTSDQNITPLFGKAEKKYRKGSLFIVLVLK